MIRLKHNQHAMWHPHQLNEDEIDFIIRRMDAVKFINVREKEYRHYTQEDLDKFDFLKKELKILQSLKTKLDVWTK